MPDNTIRGRFAPSPSGRLHLGNMLTFLLAWLDVRALGGTMVFRLEDLDPERSWEHYADLMADDLLWLGLDWDEGWHPGSQDCRQGTRAQRYTAALNALTERGMVYDCYCSRAERLAASAPHPGEPREAGCPCRTLSELEVQKRLRMGRRAAKKLEAMQEDIRTDVDFVLTYEELMGIFEAKEINFSTLPDSPDLDEGTRAGRGFAVAGGVAAAVEELIHKEHPDIELKTQRADGLRDCRKLLMLAKAGKLDGYLLEGMACPGGCVAGAGTVVSADTAAKKLAQHMTQASGKTAEDSKYRDLADQLN